jgi:hypothetical protein
MAADDGRRAVLTAVEGNPEAEVGPRQGAAVVEERPIDPVLLVVGGQNQVEAQWIAP